MKQSAKEQFLYSVTEGLENFDYNERLKEELADHFDDALYDRHIKGINEQQAEKEALTSLGDPNHIANNYNITMKKLQKPTFYRELFLIWIVSFPLYLFLLIMLPTSIQNFFALNGLLSFDSSIPYNQIIAFALAIPIACIVCFLFYILTLKNIYQDIIESKRRYRIFALLLSIPFLFIVYSILLPIVLSFTEATNSTFLDPEHPLLSLATTALYFLYRCIIVFIGYIAIRISLAFFQKKEQQLFQNKNIHMPNKQIRWFPFSMLCLVLLYLLYWITQPFFGSPTPSPSATSTILRVLFFPFQIGNFFLFFLNIVSTILLRGFFSILTIQYIVFTIVFGVCIVSLWHISRYIYEKFVQKKLRSFPYLAAIVFTYTIAMLFFSPIPKRSFEWHVPVVPIATIIEKQQLGPAYHFSKFLNADEGHAFHYTIASDGDQLFINQNSGNRFILSDIESIKKYRLTKQKDESTEQISWSDGYYGNTLATLGFKCDLSQYDLPENIDEIPKSCNSLTYNGHTIYTEGEDFSWQLGPIVLTKDKQWALFQMIGGAYDPSTVFLVDLRGL
ncbi:MAG TPA: permease prefix domain 1-containing protein [Patescibacteria group bacterium]|nr:permease prefix domain 1-containing protein [Patescibacteria group bacterium]